MATAAPSYPAPAVIQSDPAMATPPAVAVPGPDVPKKVLNGSELKRLADHLSKLFDQYKSDRRIQEERWLRNLRQYLGYYDPEVERGMVPNKSRAYPKLTRVKCLSLKARIMDLMFPSDERNWNLKASAAPDMAPDDVRAAVQKAQALDQAAGAQVQVDQDYVMAAVKAMADERAEDLMELIDDQLQELGGDQSYDYVALNGEVVHSAINYGMGVLMGPYVRKETVHSWQLDPTDGAPMPRQVDLYMPMFKFRRVWDVFPDMTANRVEDGDGYFTREVMSKSQLRKLGKRPDFFGDQIKNYLRSSPTGNYVMLPFETSLRYMGTKENTNPQKADTQKYEVIVWHGPVDGSYLRAAGIDVAEADVTEEIDAEIWMVDGWVIKAIMNPWAELGVDLRTIHYFLFDPDDTSPIGFGLPNVLRDTQMSISAATRMMLDNASVICGPMLEVNVNLLRANQDVTALQAYKIFYRDDDAPTAQFPAVREIKVESHVAELMSIIKLFMEFADMESFVGAATGGDMSRMPSEPMRNAAGASMLMGSAALPFKEIIRNYDRFTMSVVQSLVAFNRKFNPDKAKVAMYDVIARGASSLIAKELRGMQLDALSQSLKPEEMLHVDERKMVRQKFAVRDLQDMLVSEPEAARRKASADQQAAIMQKAQQDLAEANTRNVLSQAFKNISQGQKNQMGANATAVQTALDILMHGLEDNGNNPPTPQNGGPEAGGGAPTGSDPAATGQPPVPVSSGLGSGMVPDVSGAASIGAAGASGGPAGTGFGL